MDPPQFNSVVAGIQAQRAADALGVQADKDLKQMYGAAITVTVNLSKEDFEMLQQMCPGVFLVPKVTEGSTPQHGFVAASRNVAYATQRHLFGLNDLGKKVLFLGATGKEIREFYGYDGQLRTRKDGSREETAEVHFQLHCSEPKDLPRMLGSADFIVKQSAGESSHVGLRHKNGLYRSLGAANACDAAKRLRMTVNSSGANILGGRVWIGDELPTNVETLILRDVGYDFNEQDWCEYFRRTGAAVAYVTLMIPDEITYPDLPKHDRYDFHKLRNGRVAVTFANCPASGYIHHPDTWALLLRRHFLKPKLGSGGPTLQVEAMGRYGTSYAFKVFPVSILKSRGSGVVPSTTKFKAPGDYAELCAVRRIPLPKCLHYVMALDIEESISDGTFVGLRYFPVRAVEFAKLAHHLRSVKGEGLRITYAYGYLNRMRPGMFFGGQTDVGRWHVSDRDAPKLALAAFAYAVCANAEAMEALESVKDHASLWNRVVARVKRCAMAVATLGVTELLHLLRRSNMADKLVLYPDMNVFKLEHVTVKCDESGDNLDWIDVAEPPGPATPPGPTTTPVASGVAATAQAEPAAATSDIPEADSIIPLTPAVHCEWCARLPKALLGRQRVTCRHCADSNFEFHLRGDRWSRVKSTLDSAVEEADGKPQLRNLLNAVITKAEALNSSYGDIGQLVHRCEVRKVLAPPGCGKTHCLKNSTHHADGIVMPLEELRQELVREKLVRCDSSSCSRCDCKCSKGMDLAKVHRLKTQHHAIMTMPHVDVLRIDEAMSMDADIINLIVLATTPRVVELYGDARQYRCMEAHGTDITAFFGDMWGKMSEHVLHVNFRNPPAIVAWLKRMNYDIEPASDYKGPALRVASTSEESSYRRTEGAAATVDSTSIRPFFCLTKSGVTQAGYSADEKRTVRCQQGRTLKEAIWFVTRACSQHGGGEAQVRDAGVIVAMTRCKETLTVVHDGTNEAKGLLATYGISTENFDTLMFAQTGQPLCADPGEHHEVAAEEIGVPVVRNADDAFRHVEAMLPGQLTAADSQPINIPQSQVIAPEATRARVELDAFVAPVTSSGTVQQQCQTASVMSTGARVYASGDPSQTLNVATIRYGAKSKPMPLHGRGVATKVAKHYFRHFVTPHRRPLSEMDVQVIEQKAWADHKAKGNDLAVNGQPIDETQFRAVVRFHLKTINKVDTGKAYADVDRQKVGQGISAWAKQPTLLFTILARYLERWMIVHQRKDRVWVTTDDGISDQDFAKEVGTRAANLKARCPNARWRTTDGVMFDSQQNAFTQEVEKALWREIGLGEELIDEYFSFRSSYLILGQGFSVRADHQKTSGEPWTKGGNGWVARALSAYLLDFDGEQLLIYKGDDFANLGVATFNEPRMNEIRDCTDLAIRMNEEPVVPGKYMPDFCGMCLVEGVLYPSIVRRFHTLVTKRFSDAEQYALYQESLRQFVKYVQDLEIGAKLSPAAADAKRLGIHPELAIGALDIMNSFCHVSKAQWEDVVFDSTITPGWLGTDPTGALTWVHANDEDPEGRRRGDEELARMGRFRQRLAPAALGDEAPRTPEVGAADVGGSAGGSGQSLSLFERSKGRCDPVRRVGPTLLRTRST